MATDPPLQLLNGETFTYISANVDAEVQLDITAHGYWNLNLAQDACFDVRVFHPNALCYHSKDVTAVCKQHESAKKREYNQIEGSVCGTWYIYTSCLHHHRQHGQRSDHLLQTFGRHVLTQT